MNNPLIEEVIQRDGQILDTTHGKSMEPMLKAGQNPIIISKVAKPLKKKDVILFRDKSGKVILHRIIKVKEDCFITRGDNMTVTETVAKSGVVGVLSGYYKGEKYIDCENNFKYRVYTFFIPLRYFRKKTFEVVRRLVPKCIKRLIRKFIKA